MRTTIYYKTIWDRSHIQSFSVAVFPGVTSIFNSYTNYITITLPLVYLHESCNARLYVIPPNDQLSCTLISSHKPWVVLNFHECSQESALHLSKTLYTCPWFNYLPKCRTLNIEQMMLTIYYFLIDMVTYKSLAQHGNTKQNTVPSVVYSICTSEYFCLPQIYHTQCLQPIVQHQLLTCKFNGILDVLIMELQHKERRVNWS